MSAGVRGLAFAAALGAVSASAQTGDAVQIAPRMDVMILQGGGDSGGLSMLPPVAGLDLPMPLAFGGEAVQGAPYSADAVTEHVQVLADGNRIVRQSTAPVHRDAIGRTRREQGIVVLGNEVGGPASRKQVHIHDPRTGVAYLLDVDARTAHRLPSPKVNVTWTDGSGGTTRTASTFDVPLPAPSPGTPVGSQAVFMRGAVVASSGPGGPGVVGQRAEKPWAERVDQLGTQTIEGVEAVGTRTTTTIAAGQIGNEQPIEVVNERWYSPTLKLLVMSRLSDPRFGETTYRLTNITRTEPSPELFEVPANFNVVSGNTIQIEKRIERKDRD